MSQAEYDTMIQDARDANPRIYRIIRMQFGSKGRTIRKNCTLTEAQEHCKRPDTKSHSIGPGSWFDGYDYMPGCKPKE